MWSISWTGEGVGEGHAGQGIWVWGMKLLSFPQSWSWHWGSRQMGPQGKAIGDSFSVDQNSKTKIARWLEEKAGPCTDHVFLVTEVGDLPNHTCAEKAPWRPKREQCQGMVYLGTFSVGCVLAKSCVCTYARILGYTKYGLWTRWIRMTGQRKPRRNAPWR